MANEIQLGSAENKPWIDSMGARVQSEADRRWRQTQQNAAKELAVYYKTRQRVVEGMAARVLDICGVPDDDPLYGDKFVGLMEVLVALSELNDLTPPKQPYQGHHGETRWATPRDDDQRVDFSTFITPEDTVPDEGGV